MKPILRLSALLCLLLLPACGNFGPVTSAPNPFAITPSRAPLILTPTPVFILPTTSATLPPPPSLTPSVTATLEITSTPDTSTPTDTPTLTDTPTPTDIIPAGDTSTPITPTPIASTSLTLLGCNTGLDVLNGMGEVTNAYVTFANRTGADITNACLTLSAADEGRAHPDKTVCLPVLANGYQVTLKLTVDTTSNTATLVQVALTSDQLSRPADPAAACPAIATNLPPDSILGIPVPIP